MQRKTRQYVPLIGKDDKPQVHMNQQTMERFRPEMRRYDYDASTCDTYLEQLGVKFPVLVKPQPPKE